MYKAWLIVLILFSFIGCSTIGTKLKDEHSQIHNIGINFYDKNKNIIKYASVTHRLFENQVYLTLSGSVKRPLGSFASRIIIVAKFMDKEGQTVIEEKEKVLFHRVGGRRNRQQEGSFFIKVPDNSEVNACTLEIEWI